MKTKTKSSTKGKVKYGKSHRGEPSRRGVVDRGLNEDEQSRITNAREDEYLEENDRFQRMPLDDVDQEEDRERKRKIEDARGEEEN